MSKQDISSFGESFANQVKSSLEKKPFSFEVAEQPVQIPKTIEPEQRIIKLKKEYKSLLLRIDMEKYNEFVECLQGFENVTGVINKLIYEYIDSHRK